MRWWKFRWYRAGIFDKVVKLESTYRFAEYAKSDYRFHCEIYLCLKKTLLFPYSLLLLDSFEWRLAFWSWKTYDLDTMFKSGFDTMIYFALVSIWTEHYFTNSAGCLSWSFCRKEVLWIGTPLMVKPTVFPSRPRDKRNK